MICLICRQAEYTGRLTTVQLERGELRFVIQNVPARVCTGCNEAYVDAEVAERLLQIAEELAAAGIFDQVRDFELNEWN
jgi:YgiT-type zinc finger domain-containing protein